MKLEVFEDASYFDMFCVRPVCSKDSNKTIHFVKKEDALVAKAVIESWVAAERQTCIDILERLHERQGPEPAHNYYLYAANVLRGEA